MPKTAEEVAEQILEWTDDWSMKPIDMKAKIAAALTAARDEALEDAAKVADLSDTMIAFNIRALKSAKQGGRE